MHNWKCKGKERLKWLGKLTKGGAFRVLASPWPRAPWGSSSAFGKAQLDEQRRGAGERERESAWASPSFRVAQGHSEGMWPSVFLAGKFPHPSTIFPPASFQSRTIGRNSVQDFSLWDSWLMRGCIASEVLCTGCSHFFKNPSNELSEVYNRSHTPLDWRGVLTAWALK